MATSLTTSTVPTAYFCGLVCSSLVSFRCVNMHAVMCRLGRSTGTRAMAACYWNATTLVLSSLRLTLRPLARPLARVGHISEGETALHGLLPAWLTLRLGRACDASNVTAYVEQQCLQQSSCSIASFPVFGDPCVEAGGSGVCTLTLVLTVSLGRRSRT